jgi:hypothetical protein
MGVVAEIFIKSPGGRNPPDPGHGHLVCMKSCNCNYLEARVWMGGLV